MILGMVSKQTGVKCDECGKYNAKKCDGCKDDHAICDACKSISW